MSLVEFLLARIAEDEALARAAEDSAYSDWVYIDDGERKLAWEFDQARVLAECEAKRRIVRRWSDPLGRWTAEQRDSARTQKEDALRCLAAVYADHPEFEEGWRL